MHYKNGREAKNGDIILTLPLPGQTYPTPTVGVLFNAKAEQGSDCNGSIAPIMGGQPPCCADLKNCLHIDDIAAATIPDSTVVPAPAQETAAPTAPPA